MPGAVRIGDVCSGHGCYSPRPNVAGSESVYVNGIGWHRQGDQWVTHCCLLSCHSGSLSIGSRSVYVNKKGAGRIGDRVSCGSTAIQGSSNVYAGG